MLIDILDKILALSFSLLILINGAMIQRIVGTWLFPACILSLFWFIYTFIPLLLLFTYPINPFAVGYITLCIVLFSWTSLLFKWKTAFKQNKLKSNPELVFNTILLRRILYFSSIIAIIAIIAQVLAQGFSLIDLVTKPLEVAETYTKNRYTYKIEHTIFSRIGLAFSYIGVIVGGLLYGSNQNKWYKRLILLIAFLPAIFIILFQGAKGMLFIQIFLFLGSLMIIQFYYNNLGLLTNNNIQKILKISLSILPLIVISFLSRGLYRMNDSSYVLAKLKGLFASYACGHLYAFSDWFTFRSGSESILEYHHEKLSYGFYTFTSLFKLFGSTKEITPGVYSEFFTYGDFFRTNIYTIFRGLITDFGFIGTFLFFILNSIIIHYIFLFFLKTRYSVFAISFLVFTIGYFYISYGISLLFWDIIIFLFFMIAIILYLNKYKFVIRGKGYSTNL